MSESDDGFLSPEEAEFYSELEERLCRCDGEDNSKCLPHNERFHSMEGIEEYDRLYGEAHGWRR